MVDGVPALRGQAAPAPLDGTKLDPHLDRATRALGQALDSWDTLHPLIGDFLKQVGVEVRAGLDRGFGHTMRDAKTGTAYTVSYVSRKDGKEITKDAWVREVAHDLVLWVEKLSRTMAAMTKAVDEAARLREFLTGGADSRPDLESASDGELIRILVDVAVARGLWRNIRERALEVGVVLNG